MRNRSHLRGIGGTLVAVLAAVTPCAAQSDTTRVTLGSKTGAQVTSGVAPRKEFLIGAGDVMSVVFWRDKDLSAEVTVRPDGKISLPLLDEIEAEGLTPAQLKDRISEEAKKYVTDPTVSVEVKTINSRHVYITGGVRKPGPYPLTTGPMTVLQLIAIAGGLDDYAKRDQISIVRNDGGKQTSYSFNYKEVLKGRKLEQNIELQPGDSVLIP